MNTDEALDRLNSDEGFWGVRLTGTSERVFKNENQIDVYIGTATTPQRTISIAEFETQYIGCRFNAMGSADEIES